MSHRFRGYLKEFQNFREKQVYNMFGNYAYVYNVKHKNKKRRSGHLNFKFTKSVEGNISYKKIL